MTNNPERAKRPDRAEDAQIIDRTATTAEEAMDAAEDVEGFVDESAYAPTDR